MKARPILFSAPMVHALLAGTKTQTRRAVKPQADSIERHDGYPDEWSPWKGGERGASILCPYGAPGERLFVRETGWQRPERSARDMREGADTWRPYEYDADGLTEADHEQLKAWGWKRRPSIHMPRAYSRITLEVTGVRVERLQEISEADAMAEGVNWEEFAGLARFTARKLYGELWETINGAGSWAANPWVWVVEFKRLAQ